MHSGMTVQIEMGLDTTGKPVAMCPSSEHSAQLAA